MARIVINEAPGFANNLGFTPDGVRRHSPASWMMSQHGGAVPKGGIVSTLQSLGSTRSMFRAATNLFGASNKKRKTGL